MTGLKHLNFLASLGHSSLTFFFGQLFLNFWLGGCGLDSVTPPLIRSSVSGGC